MTRLAQLARRFRDDSGNAILEFHYLGILLLVPLVYIMLSVLAVQQGSYGATQAAREAGRVYARTGDADLARFAAQVALDDQDVDAPMRLDIDGDYAPGAEITVVVSTVVPLPGLPDFLDRWRQRRDPGRSRTRGGRRYLSEQSMSTLSRLRSDDSGQLAIMIIGFAVIVMMFVTLIANTSKAFLWRRSLSSWADAAALAATQTAGEDVIFDGGLTGNLPVDEAAAETFVVDYLDRQHLAERYPDLSVDVAVDQSTGVVTVTLSATMPLAFVNDVTDSFGEGVPIEGSASAVAPLR